jgi:SAM-dependent methyltransferase
MTASARCPVCDGTDTRLRLRLSGLPFHGHRLCASREAALAAPRGEMELRQCAACGHDFNAAFEPDRMQYDGGYENSLEHSAVFRAYADRLAADLIERWNVRGRDVLEVAGGDGAFLRRLCQRGGNRGIGYDPAYRGLSPGDDAPARILPEFFADTHATASADLVCCRHALEHVARPVPFLARMRRAARPTGHLYLEVPNGERTLNGSAIWDLLYEHCSYFTEHSLRRCARRAGWAVEEIASAYGDQYLCLYGRAGDADGPDAAVGPPAAEAIDLTDSLSRLLDSWTSQLATWQAEGKRVVAWGAGTKAITFLNILQPAAVAAVIDINTRKQGCFIPGTGHPILGPSSLTMNPPDVVLILNPLYEREIREMAGRDDRAIRFECV